MLRAALRFLLQAFFIYLVLFSILLHLGFVRGDLRIVSSLMPHEDKSCKETQNLFLAFYLVSEKPKEKNFQIKANQTCCKLVGMKAFLSTQCLGLKNHVQRCHIS